MLIAAVTKKPILVTAELAAYHLQRLGVRASSATVRQWARRGHVKVHRGGWQRYDLREIEEYARQRGLVA